MKVNQQIIPHKKIKFLCIKDNQNTCKENFLYAYTMCRTKPTKISRLPTETEEVGLPVSKLPSIGDALQGFTEHNLTRLKFTLIPPVAPFEGKAELLTQTGC